MQNLLTNFFDLLFPPSEDQIRVRALKEEDISLHTHEKTVEGVIVLSDFRDPSVRALIHETKFHGNTRATKLLGVMLETHLAGQVRAYDVLIPIPLSPTRLRERGYNQVHEVLCHTPSARGLTNTTLLCRTRNTRPQTELDRSERLTNMKDAFLVHSPPLVTGKHILLIDDVMTTGATLHAAKAALLPHTPASVTCLALAH